MSSIAGPVAAAPAAGEAARRHRRYEDEEFSAGATAHVLVLLLLLALPARLPATEPREGRGPDVDLIRLEGRVGPPEPGRSAAADLELGLGEQRIRLQAESARVLRGERMGADFLGEASTQRPSLIVYGPPELAEQLGRVRPGDHVVVNGYHRSGSRSFTLSAVEVEPGLPATPRGQVPPKRGERFSRIGAHAHRGELVLGGRRPRLKTLKRSMRVT